MGPVVEQALSSKAIEQSSPVVEQAPPLVATEKLRSRQDSLARAKESQVMSQLEATLAPLGDITGKGGVSSAPKGIEAKLHLLINNTDPAQLTVI